MIGLILAAALVQTGDPCMAVPQGDTHRSCPPWRSIRRNARFEIFQNPASVVRRGGTFEISLRLVYDANQQNRVRSLVSRHIYDCARRTVTMLHITIYDAGGRIIEDRGPRPHETVPGTWGPEAPGDALLAQYCPR